MSLRYEDCPICGARSLNKHNPVGVPTLLHCPNGHVWDEEMGDGPRRQEHYYAAPGTEYPMRGKAVPEMASVPTQRVHSDLLSASRHAVAIPRVPDFVIAEIDPAILESRQKLLGKA